MNWGSVITGQDSIRKKRGSIKKQTGIFRVIRGLMDQYAWLDFALGDTVSANRHLEELISVRKKESWSDARIEGYLAYVYRHGRHAGKG